MFTSASMHLAEVAFTEDINLTVVDAFVRCAAVLQQFPASPGLLRYPTAVLTVSLAEVCLIKVFTIYLLPLPFLFLGIDSGFLT